MHNEKGWVFNSPNIFDLKTEKSGQAISIPLEAIWEEFNFTFYLH